MGAPREREESSLVDWQAKRRIFICSSSGRAGKRYKVGSGVVYLGDKRCKEERENTCVIRFDGTLGG